MLDESHPFFFDHPLDHISGLQLGAAMSEATRLAHFERCGYPPENALLVSQFKLEFVELCRKQPDALVQVATTSEQGRYEATVSLNGRIKARASIVYSPCAPRQEGSSASLPAAQPANCQLLNKRNPANVLLSEAGGSTQRAGCWLLPQNEASFFTDFPQGMIDVVVLSEAVRQGLRLFFGADEPAGQGGAIDQVDLLKSLEVSLDRALYWDEGVYLEITVRDKLQSGNATSLQLEGRFIVDGLAVGRFAVSALTVSADWQEQRNTPSRSGPL